MVVFYNTRKTTKWTRGASALSMFCEVFWTEKFTEITEFVNHYYDGRATKYRCKLSSCKPTAYNRNHHMSRRRWRFPPAPKCWNWRRLSFFLSPLSCQSRYAPFVQKTSLAKNSGFWAVLVLQSMEDLAWGLVVFMWAYSQLALH